MNRVEREKMVRAMEFITRQVNDEEVFENWLINGVADGDINYGDICPNGDEDIEYYIEDNDTFKDLMTQFLWTMKEAWKSGGLYCDGVVSDDRESI